MKTFAIILGAYLAGYFLTYRFVTWLETLNDTLYQRFITTEMPLSMLFPITFPYIFITSFVPVIMKYLGELVRYKGKKGGVMAMKNNDTTDILLAACIVVCLIALGFFIINLV